MATNRNSADYATLHVNQAAGQLATLRGGRTYEIPFAHTVVSGETGGASAGVHDTVNLCKLPAHCKVVGLDIAANDLWASAGVNGTFQLGDSGDDDRYLAATESFSASGPTATDKPKEGLAFTGQNYVPTADTIVVLKWKTANPVVGKIVRGCFRVILAE